MSQLWKSALNQGMDPRVEKLNRSMPFDCRLWKEDIEGSQAHLKMLVQANLLPELDAAKIRKALDEVEAGIAQGEISPQPVDEDVHSWIEREVVEKVGPIGSNIHIARSRNEQILLDVKLYMRKTLTDFEQKLNQSIEAVKQLEQEAQDTLLPSYTHLRRAQPLFLREYWETYRITLEITRRNFQWVKNQINEECPMGAGAIHGTTLPTKPEFEAEILGFERSPRNSLFTVSNRRFVLDFMGQCTHFMLDLSRFMEDLIVFSTDEFGYLTFQHTVTSGSSMMPQKRNPDLCELIRGKSASILGHYTATLALMKGLPMGYMKDLQEDKIHLFAVIDTLNDILDALPVLFSAITVKADTMIQAASDPQLLATDEMEKLVLKGVPLRQAHHEIARSVAQDLAQAQNQNHRDPELAKSLSLESCKKRNSGIERAYNLGGNSD